MPPVDVAISLQLHSPTTCHHHPPNQPRTAPSATFAPSPSPHVHRIYTESVFSRSLALSLSTGGLSVCLSLTPHPSPLIHPHLPTHLLRVCPLRGLAFSRALSLFCTHPPGTRCVYSQMGLRLSINIASYTPPLYDLSIVRLARLQLEAQLGIEHQDDGTVAPPQADDSAAAEDPGENQIGLEGADHREGH